MGVRNNPCVPVFKHLRTHVLQQIRENGWNSIAIVSPDSGCGKSFLAANLGIALSMEVNQTVLLVDVDFYRPKLGWHFGVENEKGIVNYLYDDYPVEKLLINPGFDRLVILPAGKGSEDVSSELLTLPKMTELINDIKSRYQSRIILFDLPPLLASDDAMLFMPNYDSALLVVEDGKTSPDAVSRSLSLLHETNVLGTVLNKTTANKNNYLY